MMSFGKESSSVNKKLKTAAVVLQPCIIKQETPTNPNLQPSNASSSIIDDNNIAVNASSSDAAPAIDVEAVSKKKNNDDNDPEKNYNNDDDDDDDDGDGDGDDDDDNYLDSFPPGYRFCPRDEELVLYYLKKRVLNEPLPQNRIMEVNLYHHNPEYLAEQYKQYGEKEWYFFTPRDKKYRNGKRPNRAAGDGYWKATGADREVKFKDQVVGYRKALVFYKGKPPKGDKTNWIMHEYRVNDPPPCKRLYSDMRLDDWVLCRVFKKVDKSTRTPHKDEDSPSLIHAHELDFNYNSNADYSNDMCSFMHQPFSDEPYTNFQHNDSNHYPGSLSSNYGISHPNIGGAQDCDPIIRGGQDCHPILRGGAGQDCHPIISGGQDNIWNVANLDIWNVANLDFSSELDFYGVSYVEPLINLDSIISTDAPNKDVSISEMNERG